MVKTKAKIIIAFVVTFITVCLFNVNTVQAVEITETEIQEIINSIIPDTMALDIPEVEYKKAEELVPANIKRILKEKSIQYEEVNGNYQIKSIKLKMNEKEFMIDFCSISPIDFGNFKEFYTAKINININNYPTKTKTIQLEYNNHNNYNSADETYVKNLKIDFPKYFEVPIDYLNNDIGEYWSKLVKDYINNINKDDDIVFEVSVDGGGAEITMGGVPHVAIFKNGVLYDAKCYEDVDILFIPVIEVPSTIENDKVNEYVANLVEKYSYYPVISIEKGCTSGNWFQYHGETCSNIPDIYTITVSDGTETIEDIAIIRKKINVQDILELIPDTMELDIPEVEYEKSKEIILSRVKETLKDASIQYEDIEEGVKLKDLKIDGNDIVISSSLPPIYTIIDEFYSTHIYVYTTNGETSSNKGVKTIQLKYNNTEKRNSEDEKFVKSLKIESPFYYEVPLDYMSKGKAWNEFFKVVGDYHTKLIEDSSIIVKAEAGAGGADGSLNIGTHGLSLAIFKNGILYEIRGIKNASSIPVVNVPSTIAEEKVNDYVIELIKKYYPEYGNTITKIEKGTQGLTQQYGEIDIPNSYTIYGSDMESYIIIRKEKAVTSSDNETKIKFETTSTVVPEDTKLVVDEVKEENTLNKIKETLKEISNKYVVFDISLVHNDEKIQPNGNVKISIPVPEGFDTSKLVVFRIEEDGTKVEFKVNVVEIDGTKYAQFETNHFSNYVLAEKTVENNRVLDDQPKTGIIDLKVIVGMVMVAFTIVVVKNKRKKA